MASLNCYTTVVLVALCATSVVILPSFYGQDDSEPDPWFTQEHQRPNLAEDETSSKEIDKSPALIKRTNVSSAVARKSKRELENVPANNLKKRIKLLEDIVSSSKPSDDDIRLLKELKDTRSNAIRAIQEASQSHDSIFNAMELLKTYSSYYKGDTSLLVELIESSFSERLLDLAGSLGRRGETEEIARIKSQLQATGLSPVFEERIEKAATVAMRSMIARQIEDISQSDKQLPGEAYLISRMFNQNSGRLRLAINLPQSADPRLASNITRSIENQWGEHIQTTSLNSRSTVPELILNVDTLGIHVTNTVNERIIQSIVPGTTTEHVNPEFQKLFKRYEKAFKVYQSELSQFEERYAIYLDQMNDSEYLESLQHNPKTEVMDPNAESSAWGSDSTSQQIQGLASYSKSVSKPILNEPQKPFPHHLDILEKLYVIPSTIVSREEEEHYEYTEQALAFVIETEAPVSLQIPQIENLSIQSRVALNQNRRWIKNIGVDPRDPKATAGSYTEDEYESALDIFGLEFGSNCSNVLTQLLQQMSIQLNSMASKDSIEQSLLAVALQSITSNDATEPLTQSELQQLVDFARKDTTSNLAFRAKCLATLLSKTQFAHLANEERIIEILNHSS